MNAILTALIFLATVANIMVFYLESEAASKQTDKLAGYASQQACAARSFAKSAGEIDGEIGDAESDFSQMAMNSEGAIKATQEQMRQDQRAWLGIESVQAGGDFSDANGFPIQITFSNSGKSPARHVTFSVRYIFRPIRISGPPPEEIAKLEQTPGNDIPPGGKLVRLLTNSSTGAFPYTPEQIQGMQDLTSHFNDIFEGRSILYYFGRVIYEDVFGKRHFTDYCMVIIDPKKKVIGPCDEFNDIQ